jgi:hypothetical protein
MAKWGSDDRREEDDGARMAIDQWLFNNSMSTLVDHLTRHYGEDVNIETYVICARVRSARACNELGRKPHRNADCTVGLVPSRFPFPLFLSLS